MSKHASETRPVARCARCAATGQFITGTVNGVPTGPGGICFRCEGKGWLSEADRRRNDAYDRYGWRVNL